MYLLQSIKVERMADTDFHPDQLFPVCYEYREDLTAPLHADGFLRLLSSGSGSICQPFSIKIQSPEIFLIVDTLGGGVRCSEGNSAVSVTEGHLLLISCKNPVSLRPLVLPWNFRIFLAQGAALQSYLPLAADSSPAVFPSEEQPAIRFALEELLSCPAQVHRSGLLQMNLALTQVLTEACCRNIPDDSDDRPLPFYLRKMRDRIAGDFQQPFSLIALEKEMQISRYRLCREYTEAFGIPPLKDLTGHRIKEAKKMLISTNLQIQEISSRIGYDNPAHFINMFRKNCGVTPKVFRQTAQEARPSSHSCAQ